MIFQQCTNIDCDRRFSPGKTRRKLFCGKKCSNEYHDKLRRVERWMTRGYTLDGMLLISNLKRDEISSLIARIETRDKPLTIHMSPEMRILDEEYLIKSPNFYLPESDRIKFTVNNLQNPPLI